MTLTKVLNIVFLHGWGMNKGIWDKFIRYCQERSPSNVRFSAIDMLGCGANMKKFSGPLTLKSISNDVREKLEPNSILVGWSLGGLVAQDIAQQRHSGLVAHIQIASTPKFVQTDDWYGIKHDILAQFSQQLQTDHSGLLRRFLSIQCLGVENPKIHVKTMIEAICKYPLSNQADLASLLTILIETDLRTTGSKSTNPISCARIYGCLDSLVPKKAIPKIESIYPHDPTFRIPKASHAPFISHPLETFNAIQTFINSISGQSR